EVPSLVEALGWCSVVRDLEDDQRKGLDNIPSDVDYDALSRESLLRVRETLQRSALEIARLNDARARRILGIFQRSVEKYARVSDPSTARYRPTSARASALPPAPPEPPADRTTGIAEVWT